jgi:epoxyqueuosine reductase
VNSGRAGIQQLPSRIPRPADERGARRCKRRYTAAVSTPSYAADAPAPDLAALKREIAGWARELGFGRIGIAGIDLQGAHERLVEWLGRGWNGDMDYLARHGTRRSHPDELVPGTVRVLSARLDYFPPQARDAGSVLEDASLGYVSRYALGRDYHKVLRARLQRLAERMDERVPGHRYRVFTDSAPVMEVELAARAGLGWRGKHTLLLDREAGSWFFLGEIYTDLALPIDGSQPEHCGTCERCIEVCPTRAIVAPYQLEARRCISYLTIEHKGSIPEALRPLLGNRIYGCDDCQLVCPWNKFARTATLPDFEVRNGLDAPALVALFRWTQAQFLERTEGSAIRRIGYERWLRNVAVALGNAPRSGQVLAALEEKRDHPSALVREHVSWAIERREGRREARG